MRRFVILTRMFVLMNLRERETLFWNFVFPIILLLTLSTAFGDSSQDGVEAAGWIMAGVIVQNIMAAGLTGDSAWLVSLRDRGVLSRLRVSPLPATVLVGAYVVVRLLLVIVQSALIVGVTMAVFGVRPGWSDIAPSLVVVLTGALVFLLLGQAIAAVAPNANATNVISSMLFFPILFLSNLVINAETFPGWLAAIARWTPASMLVDVLRPLLTTASPAHAAWTNLVGLLVFGVAALVIVARWFRWEPRR